MRQPIGTDRTAVAAKTESGRLCTVTVQRDPLGDHLHPYHVVGVYDASLAISLRVADCVTIYCPVDECPDEYRVAFVDPLADSWATVHYRPGVDEYQVHQAGSRQLWTEVVSAYQWWRDAGGPKADQWQVTVTPREQLVELVPPTALR